MGPTSQALRWSTFLSTSFVCNSRFVTRGWRWCEWHAWVRIKLPRPIRPCGTQQEPPKLCRPHHPSPHPSWPTWIGINLDRRVSSREDLERNVRQSGEYVLRETRPRRAWLRVTGHKFSTHRPRPHLRSLDLRPTVTRSSMKMRSRCLTGTNAKSCWTPTEASFTTRQVKHPPPLSLQFNAQRMRRDAHANSCFFEGETDSVKEEMKPKLNELIVSVFRKRPTLNYYQVRILLF